MENVLLAVTFIAMGVSLFCTVLCTWALRSMAYSIRKIETRYMRVTEPTEDYRVPESQKSDWLDDFE